MKVSRTKKLVYVAMSGGVDSSVAAALLKKQGYDVTGVFMRPWSPEAGKTQITKHKSQTNSKFQIQNSENYCPWKQDREDAMRVAARIGIPLLTWDFSKEYKKEVADYMIREYRAGRTPNPDVMCNKHIKFGLFLEKALKEGADFIATGHYVRITKHESRNVKQKSGSGAYFVLRVARDKNKDQSYFLWTLTQKQLKYCLFPVGDYIKPEIRRMAKKFSLPTADKKDSQGVCFVGSLDMKEFLKNYIKPKMGKIFDMDGNLLGEHDGVFYYTIGQRHGLDIKNGKGPYYVARKDIKKNVIHVSGAPQNTPHQTSPLTAIKKRGGFGAGQANQQHKITLKDVSWIGERPKLPAKINVKIRYRSESIPVMLTKTRSNYCATALLGYQLQAITPGQSAVFYKGEEMLGGGIIK